MVLYKLDKLQERAKPMPLQFPNARLLIHELLAQNKFSGPEAILQVACQYGLITPDTAAEILRQETAGCRCLATAKKVMQKHFGEKAEQVDYPAVNVDEAWSAVERCIESYKESSSRFPSECNPHDHPADKPHECSKLAPALFDYLLQQLRLYS